MRIKSVVDVVISFFALIILSPLFLLIALLILLSSKGPILFCQKRIGRHGRVFTMYKFRTMVNKNHNHLDSIVNKSLVTALGNFLRKWKIDELPEFWNVLKGDMSIVGPRPYISGFSDKLEGEEKKILDLKPGLTSLASIKYIGEEKILFQQEYPGKYYRDVIYPDKIRLDLIYFENSEILLDLKIIWYTIFPWKRKKFLNSFE
jgi:lipopolysaccharide/colanic/teichoic acid biosynthesis glycosyltransferase